jgi:hypothetical protein
MKTRNLFFILLVLFIFINQISIAQETMDNKNESTIVQDNEKLVVVWTSGDVDVAIKMVYMYTYNAKKYGWWKDVTFIIWGPSSKLLSENTELQDYLKKMKDEGIALEACKACAEMYGIADILTELGVDVKYMGTALTEYIKSERHVITF